MASLVPDTVTALSVELGSISDATTTEAPVISRISFIFEPPLPIKEPHWDAGMIKRSVMGGLGMAVPANGPPTSYGNTKHTHKSRRELGPVKLRRKVNQHTKGKP